MNMNKIFDAFDEADPSNAGGRSDSITVHGTHTVEVEAVRVKESEQYSAIYLIVDYKVLSTTNDSVSVGATYAWVHDLTNKWFGASNAKQFVASAAGLDPKSDDAKAIDRTAMQDAWSDENPLAGQKLQLKTTPKTTKNDRTITVHAWSPVGA